MAAKEHAGHLSVMHLHDSNLSKMRNYYGFVPSAIEEALDEDYKRFLGIRQVAEVLRGC